MIQPRLLPILLPLLACACAPPTLDYHVIVTNRTAEPITVWITKAHPPYEPAWDPPEAIQPDQPQTLGGREVDPDYTAEIKISGQFDNDNFAILRIYGSEKMEEILKMSPLSDKRLDVDLKPGDTNLDVVLVNGELATQPHMPGHPAGP
jgi:hypothetical protein